MITHLPPGIVGLLNAVFWRQEDYETELDSFVDTWNSVRDWHTFHGSYSVNDTEQRNLDNFLLLWDDVHSQLEEEIEFEKLAQPIYETIGIMNQLNEDRRFPHYSPIPAVNEILLSGAAFCMDRGSEEGLRDRLPMLAECITNLRGLYFEQEYRLPDEVKDALNQGFEVMEQGLESIHKGLPHKDAAQGGLAEVKDGASLVEFLLEWDRNEKQRLSEKYSRFNIPLIGSDLEIGYESVKSVERRKWRRGAKNTEEELLPKLDEFWEMIKPHLFLMPEERAELLEGVDQSIEALKSAVAALKEKDGEDEELQENLREALEWTGEAFTSIEDLTLKPETFKDGTPERNIFDAAKGILGGTVPDAALVELLNSSPPGQDVLEAFSAFINEGDEEQMVLAVWLMFDAVEAREEADENQTRPWTCGLCGFHNEAGNLSCKECRVVRKTV